MDLQLRGLAYVVTGATRGLGYATASALTAEGASVVISGQTPESVRHAAATLGDQCTGVVADNADPAAAQSLVDAAVERYGRLDGALLSVGGPPPSALLDTTDEAWASAFNSLFIGALRIAKLCISRMSGPGAIGFVLSSSVRSPIPGLALSNGLRPALAMAAKTLADEVGPRGIRVLGLAPGRIATERTNELDRSRPGAREKSEAAIPLRRLGEPDEFGRVAAFVLSPAASYLTGSVVYVDGGMIRAL